MFGRRRGTETLQWGEGPSGTVPAGPVPALVLDTVRRTYPGGVTALDGVSLRVPAGRMVAVLGRSGSGKSTLLQCAAGLDRPTSGTVLIGGTELAGLGEAALTRLRRDRVGFVFQSLNLVPSLSVLENAALPLLLAARGADARARAALAAVGLADRAEDRPAQLSGGQQQRVAVARALVTEPDVVFADEPTGALDPATAAEVLALLRHAADEGRTVVLVTHDPVAAAWADEAVFLHAGRIVAHEAAPRAEAVRALLHELGLTSDGVPDGWPDPSPYERGAEAHRGSGAASRYERSPR
ncbi:MULTISPECIES: ABC transporter ATP-binding protein [Streptomyces]|uniref:ABC transporter ATP-binding protein n=1 Tax=Streptomyces TaxID=1883 RepID=UPI00067AE035|nr:MULTISPECIES: ABC transporter ATP-binding protein [Streptomyces]MDX2916946.1 ABC transporter ATP-binding protein [Streptomyces sp. NE06-03C]MDX3607021.1 ABC transporter ATP-binding protein [Streptomyces sp. FL06-04B]MDX3735549.1 ABC transporter ATP-binding protein [Streptomyces sp. ID01-15D]